MPDEPQFWNSKFALLYLILLLICVAVLVIVLIALSFAPVSEKMSVIAQSGNIMILPKPSHTSWLTRLSIQTKGPCSRELYQLPCSDIQVKHDENYDPSGNQDFIYCTSNSTVVFNQTGAQAGDGFVTDNYDAILSYDNDNYNCTNAPGNVRCIHFDYKKTSSPIVKNISINLPPYVGNYYYIRKSYKIYSIIFHINRFSVRYDDSYKDKNHYKGPNTKTNPLCVVLQDIFRPWSFKDSKDCLLLNVIRDDCFGSPIHHQYFDIIPERRYDILVWAAPAFFVLIVFIGLCIFFLDNGFTIELKDDHGCVGLLTDVKIDVPF